MSDQDKNNNEKRQQKVIISVCCVPSFGIFEFQFGDAEKKEEPVIKKTYSPEKVEEILEITEVVKTRAVGALCYFNTMTDPNAAENCRLLLANVVGALKDLKPLLASPEQAEAGSCIAGLRGVQADLELIAKNPRKADYTRLGEHLESISQVGMMIDSIMQTFEEDGYEAEVDTLREYRDEIETKAVTMVQFLNGDDSPEENETDAKAEKADAKASTRLTKDDVSKLLELSEGVWKKLISFVQVHYAFMKQPNKTIITTMSEISSDVVGLLEQMKPLVPFAEHVIEERISSIQGVSKGLDMIVKDFPISDLTSIPYHLETLSHTGNAFGEIGEFLKREYHDFYNDGCQLVAKKADIDGLLGDLVKSFWTTETDFVEDPASEQPNQQDKVDAETPNKEEAKPDTGDTPEEACEMVCFTICVCPCGGIMLNW